MLKVRDEYNGKQVVLTGVRAIVILALLDIEPRTFKEIKDFLINTGIVDREYSIDTIRSDINSLKYVGCDISRATKRTNHKFTLHSHPFQFHLSVEEVDAIQKTYNHIYKKISIEKLIKFDDFFKKLARSVKDNEVKELLLGISELKNINKELLKEFIIALKKNSTINIEYLANNSYETQYKITVEDIKIRNEKLYIYCFNHSIKKRSFLKFSRIKRILATFISSENVEIKDTIIEFKLNNHSNYVLEKTEQIIECTQDYAIIRGEYYTEFIAMQRILSFGADAFVISPSEFKESIIQKLKNMRNNYD